MALHILRYFLVAFSALVLISATPKKTPTVAQMAPYLKPQRLVDVGGRRLNIYCTGIGSPAVILDSGAGGSTEDWHKIQEPVSRHTRVCSYDRAGMGFSDGTTSKRDPNAVVSDLHALLHRAGIQPPYVLVAHSIAGLYAPLYADRYPDEVVGMVLVDPSRPFQRKKLAVAPAFTKLDDQQTQMMQRCYAYLSQSAPTDVQLSAVCGFPTQAQQRTICANEGPGLCAVDKVQFEQARHALYWRDLLSEKTEALGDSGSSEVERAQRSYGSMPLIVLTADDRTAASRQQMASIPKAQFDALWKQWKTMHDQLAAYSSTGVNFVVQGSGHYIHQDRPAVVISAIEEVLAQARARI